MDLREALEQISEIRQQVAQTETFRGYRAAPVAFSGLVAWVAAALCQNFLWMPTPSLPAVRRSAYSPPQRSGSGRPS